MLNNADLANAENLNDITAAPILLLDCSALLGLVDTSSATRGDTQNRNYSAGRIRPRTEVY